MSADADELSLVSPNVCPACGQKLKPARRRICGSCNQPILKGHKFVFDGSTVRHRNCARPTERPKAVAS